MRWRSVDVVVNTKINADEGLTRLLSGWNHEGDIVEAAFTNMMTVNGKGVVCRKSNEIKELTTEIYVLPLGSFSYGLASFCPENKSEIPCPSYIAS